jgi:hypothetical protein
MTPDEKKHLACVELALQKTWGALLLASMRTDDPFIKAAFLKAQEECAKTGLMAREGMRFIEQPPA